MVDNVEFLLKKKKKQRPLTTFEIELSLKGDKSKGSIYKELDKLVNKDKSVIRFELSIPGIKNKLILYKLKKN